MSIPSPRDEKLPIGAVILAGGNSSRMGLDKRFLPWNGKPVLQHLVDVMGDIADRLVISCQSGERKMLAESPSLSLKKCDPKIVEIVQDSRSGLGPIEGLRNGLRMLQPHVDHAFVISCDSPLVRIDLIRFLFEQIEDYQAVMPFINEKIYGLTAIYRTDVVETIDEQIEQGNRQIKRLALSLQTRLVDANQLRLHDPQLESLANLNTMDEYFLWLERANRNDERKPNR